MAWLQDVTVRVKVIIAFTVVVAGALMVGGAGFRQLSEVNEKASEVRDNWLPSVASLGRLTELASRYRIREGVYILADDEAARAVEGRLMRENLDQTAAAMAVYEKLLTPGYETETFNKLSAHWRDYLRLSADRLQAAAARGDTALARQVYGGDSRQAFQNIRVLLLELTDFNERESVKAANKGEAAYAAGKIEIGGFLLGVVLLSMGAGWAIIASVSRPVQDMTGAMTNLARRELATEIPGATRKDEIGEMARAVQVFKDGLIEAERLAAEQAAEQAAKQRRADNVERLVHDFEGAAALALRTVASAASELDATAHAMTNMAQNTSAQASAVSAAAEQTSANVQTVATATEEMTSTAREIASQVARSTSIAGKAVEEAAKTTSAVQNLADAAQKIGDVLSLIGEIAGQTNLLALNATIEAARAGEAGKGFAVVASEVKSLAGQTAKATDQISSQIAAIQSTTGDVVAAISGIGGTISQINEISTAIAAAIEEQSAATNEIARSIQQAAGGTQEVTGNILKVTQTAAETGAAAEQVLGAAGGVSRQAESLRRDVDGFLSAIKAA